MTDCNLCYKPMLDGQELEHAVHKICSDEWYNRFNNNMCIRCGKNKKAEMSQKCPNCAGLEDYQGYEGPAS